MIVGGWSVVLAMVQELPSPRDPPRLTAHPLPPPASAPLPSLRPQPGVHASRPQPVTGHRRRPGRRVVAAAAATDQALCGRRAAGTRPHRALGLLAAAAATDQAFPSGAAAR